ncbi:MAG: PocR ligand-binding domain-containing protein [Deltaproteobacteria bacterium]|nr:PocR ligand-binding domain-containing protein [Deltaproteobacteria bacterium]
MPESALVAPGLPPPAPAAEGALQKQLALADLVDPESFREVFQSYAELYRVGIKVFDANGTKLVDVRVGGGEFCTYLFQHGPTQQRCTALVRQLKNQDYWATAEDPTRAAVVNCFSGLRYVVQPVVHEGDYMGRIIFGPFVPQEDPKPNPLLRQWEPKLDEARLVELMSPIRRAPDEVINKVIEQMQKVIAVILFTSYRAAMVSSMHIESVTQSYQELMEKNRRMEEQNERLKELDKMKSNFLATVSHELRTPLTSIIGYSEMLLEGMAGEIQDQQREYIQTIMEKGESLMKLITSILDLSRIESGNLKLALADVDLYAVTKAALTSIVPQAAKKKVELKTDMDPGLPRITGDEDKVRQVLINLLGNAVKFTPENGTITLRVKNYFGPRKHARSGGDKTGAVALFGIAEEDFVRLEVEDSGPGIPEELLEKVFERFYQVDNSSTRVHGGTGLGLSIVKSFVDAHKGDVWAESQPGKGCKFVVLFPVVRT